VNPEDESIYPLIEDADVKYPGAKSFLSPPYKLIFVGKSHRYGYY